ncbi:hypothetical protein GTO89_14405 [Heliobacterium gestii]|uniref:Uncharacterized protein n=1 Tax=Heliomicrobium gestii TaxID=2699 RepID=A0A845LFN9_HELGE|nr:hypothetical protein [Heliomicrobium gestii]MBM7867833.1 hypothetical protein [Heliomicrobium gestii]MZP44224.1 hypothetical protein [Heliomicrobium gestii]
MARKITRVIFRKDGLEQKYNLTEVTEELYETKLKGFLFCPNETCKARILFVSGDKVTYFRTWKSKVVDGQVVNEHISDCPYFVDHELGERSYRRKSPDIYYSISEDHMKNVLRNAFDRIRHPDKFKKKPPSEDEGKKRPSSRGRIDPTLQPSGHAGLVADGATVRGEKEPNVYRKTLDELNEFDYGSVQCICGEAEGLTKGIDYPYILLKTTSGKTGRILFSEAFAAKNRIQYDNLDFYGQYIEVVKVSGQNPLICCIGRITKDNQSEVAIVIEDHYALRIENKNYYQIVDELQ